MAQTYRDRRKRTSIHGIGKRPYLSHWYKAVFGREGIKKAAPMTARLFIVNNFQILFFRSAGLAGKGIGLTFAFLIFSGDSNDIVRGSHYAG